VSEVLPADRAQHLIPLSDMLYGLAMGVFVYLLYMAVQSEVLRERLRTLWALEGLWVWDEVYFNLGFLAPHFEDVLSCFHFTSNKLLVLMASALFLPLNQCQSWLL